MSNYLADTQAAFDSVAAEYDGPSGNNILVQQIRERTMDCVRSYFQPGCHLLDLGCGTGLDAKHLAQAGYFVTATDWSPHMVERTKKRIVESSLQGKVDVVQAGFHELDRLSGIEFDGIYSNLGALNCASDIGEIASCAAKILKPNGKIIASVIGRFCPWEIAVYGLQGRFKRAFIRLATESVPVPLNGHTVWTRYYTPGEFSSAFAGSGFETIRLRTLSLFVPPPYMLRLAQKNLSLLRLLLFVDDAVGALPVLRNFGDHFLIVMESKEVKN